MTKKIKCSCSLPNESGWHLDDEVVTTYRSLRIAESEAASEMMAYVLNVYWKRGDKGMALLQDNLDKYGGKFSNDEVFCQWEA